MDTLNFLERKIGRLPKGAMDDYEIYSVEMRHFSAEAKEGEIDTIDEAVEHGCAVRLFKAGRIGFACSSDTTAPFLERMLGLAYNSLAVVEKGAIRLAPAKPDASARSGWRIPILHPDPPIGVTSQEKFQMAIDLERFARGFDRRITRVRDAAFAEEVKTVTLRNSRGLESTESRSLYELSLMVMAEDKGGQEMAWDNDFAGDFSNLDPQKVAEQTGEKAVSQLGGQPIRTQKTAAVLDPVVAASFLGVLSSSFFGDQVQKGRSALKDKVGEEVYSKEVTVTDDGTRPGGYATFPFDGEGVATRRSELVSRGGLSRFLYDLTSGSRAGCPSSGNAVRPNFKEPPRVGATNFFIEAGKGKIEDLFGEMGRGLWIRDVIGVHTADAVTGDFSLGASGIWIEGGKRRNPVRGITISGNLHEMMKRVVRVGEDPRFYHSFGSPPLLVSSIDIGGL